MSDWPTVTLKEAGVTLIDCDHKTPKAQEEGLPYIGIPQLKEGRITLDGARLITEEDFNYWRRKAKPTPNDVILSRRCNPGETAFVPEGLEIALGQNLVLLRSDGEKLYPPFLRWVVQGSNWWNQIGKFINVGAVFDSLKCVDIPKFEIMLPPIASQIRIAEILGALDKKIELNRQTNQTIEQIAQAIFKSWFVDFEPVKAKIQAKQNGQDPERAAMCSISGKTDAELDAFLEARTPEHDAQGSANVAGGMMPGATNQQITATAALFPDELEDSDLGEIPKGWEQKRVDDIFGLAYGKALKSTDRIEGDIPVYGSGGVTGCHNKHLVDGPGIIVGRKGTVGSLYWEDQSFFPIDTVFYVMPKRTPLTFCFYLLQTLGLDRMNTDAAVPGLNRNNAYRLPVIFDSVVVKRFDILVKTMRESIFSNNQQSEQLANVRDSLLPKLLSGEIQVDANQPELKAAI